MSCASRPFPTKSPTELQRKFKPLGDYLAKATGLKVEFTPVTDYAASVEGLVNNKLDMVWFGGFTFVQANVRSKGQVTPLVQRVEDEKFRSVFITTSKDINKLEDLKGKTLTFGSESSTSGHLMPRYYLLAAKINPDTDLKRIAFSGAHDATVAAVAGGKVDAGALNISVWEKLVEAKKVDPKQVRVFYTTPGYYDYNWTRAHRHEPGPAKEDHRRLPGAGRVDARRQGNPRTAARHQVHPDQGRELQARSKRRRRTPAC